MGKHIQELNNINTPILPSDIILVEREGVGCQIALNDIFSEKLESYPTIDVVNQIIQDSITDVLNTEI